MTSEPPDHPNEGSSQPSEDPTFIREEIHHPQVTARIPEKVGRGVFSTGALVFQGPQEFVIDFVLRVTQPHQIVGRVILSPAIMASFISALQENFNRYQSKFGTPAALPSPPPNTKPPSIEEIYQNLKLSDDMLSGVYANTVMVAHTPAEFCFDFITNFYPRSAVSCRVYLSAPQVSGFLKTLTRSFDDYQKKQPPKAPEAPPEEA